MARMRPHEMRQVENRPDQYGGPSNHGGVEPGLPAGGGPGYHDGGAVAASRGDHRPVHDIAAGVHGSHRPELPPDPHGGHMPSRVSQQTYGVGSGGGGGSGASDTQDYGVDDYPSSPRASRADLKD
jgi:hypothetical protein